MSIEWLPPVDIPSTLNESLFVRITKSKGEKPTYSYHFLRALPNGSSASKHLPVTITKSGMAVSLKPVILELMALAEEWISSDRVSH